MEFTLLITLLLGLLIGSFLNVCIYRIPIQFGFDQEPDAEGYIPETRSDPNLTVSYPPRSFCPRCRTQLSWYHNIPVFSWLSLGGRCAFCKESISVRYPFVELLSSLFAVLSYMLFGATLTGVVVYIFTASLIVISFIDYDYYIIPDVISLPATAIGVAIAVLNQFYPLFYAPIVPDLYISILGILAGAGFLYAVAKIYMFIRKREGLGLGDVKLLAMTGALFGPQCALYTIFIGSLLGSVLGVLLIVFGGRKASQEIPFGPYLALATVLYIFTDDLLIRWILHLLTGEPV